MKRALYDLTDEEFAFFVNNFGKQMDESQIPYILVGGAAIQAHIIKRGCTKTGKTVEQIVADPNIRVQDFIRATDDVDVALDPSIGEMGFSYFSRKMREVLEKLESEHISPSEEHIFRYHLMRKGVKRPVFQIYVDEETNDEQIISMNVSKDKSDLYNLDPSYYEKFVKEGQDISIPYSSTFSLDLRVIKPEHLLATKISRFRAKDAMDIHVLADCMKENGEKIDLQEIEQILLPNYEDNYDKFLRLIQAEE